MESMIIVRYDLVEELCSNVLATLPECYKAGFAKGLSITKIWKDVVVGQAVMIDLTSIFGQRSYTSNIKLSKVFTS